jgi:hypothetical protein
MSDNKLYLAIGEEANRGTKEATTVGFIPLAEPFKPKFEPDDKRRKEFRGEDSLLGYTTVRRVSTKWSGGPKIAMYSEAGTTKGMIGTQFKHLAGKATSSQNASTGQYLHMMYGVANPFDAANLGTKALTLNLNLNQGATMKNWPWVGGRHKSVELVQDPGEQLMANFESFGQFRDAATAEIGTPVFPAENLRFDYNGFKLYTGTITRTGTGPNFTQFAFGSATQIKPDSFKAKISVASEDKLRLAGVKYPDKTRMGIFELSAEFTIDWEDPAAGFSSADEIEAWLAGPNPREINLFALWDSGTQAGTGDNHQLNLDMPRMVLEGDLADYDLEKDPMVTLKFNGLYDATTCKYLFGLMLKNTATAV